MADEKLLTREIKELEPARVEQVVPARVGVATSGSNSRPDGDHQPQPPAETQQQRISLVKQTLITAVVALACGAMGAMGYSHFFAPGASGSGAPKTDDEAKASAKSNRGGESHVDSTEASEAHTSSSPPVASQPPAARMSAGDDANELKQRIMELSHRIERLGERVDRLQELLSLAVPLLQRIAPKG